MQLSEITVTRQAIDNRYCYCHCYRKQQSLWLLTATSDLIKIQCFFWKILRYFNSFLHVNQRAKYAVKKFIKSHSMCWASLTTSQPAYSSCFPDIYMFLKESDVDCCHIAFSKKKKKKDIRMRFRPEKWGENSFIHSFILFFILDHHNNSKCMVTQ